MTGLIAALCHQLYRQKRKLQDLLFFIHAERDLVDPAVRTLVDLLSDIANAVAISGESQYLLSKRLSNILLSPRGEGRSVRDAFVILANLYDSGLLSRLSRECPELNPSELGLCAMLTVGLDPVCISKILGYDHEHTFYNKRADVRKKLGLAHSIPLEGYLSDRVQALREEHDRYLSELTALS